MLGWVDVLLELYALIVPFSSQGITASAKLAGFSYQPEDEALMYF